MRSLTYSRLRIYFTMAIVIGVELFLTSKLIYGLGFKILYLSPMFLMLIFVMYFITKSQIELLTKINRIGEAYKVDIINGLHEVQSEIQALGGVIHKNSNTVCGSGHKSAINFGNGASAGPHTRSYGYISQSSRGATRALRAQKDVLKLFIKVEREMLSEIQNSNEI